MGESKKRCAEHVNSGARWDFTGHACQLPPVVLADGKWWCRIHSPEGKAKRDARIAARSKAYDAQWEAKKEQARKAAAYDTLHASLTEAREALREIIAWWDVEKKRTHADYYTGTWEIHPDEPEWVARARNLLDANAREGK